MLVESQVKTQRHKDRCWAEAAWQNAWSFSPSPLVFSVQFWASDQSCLKVHVGWAKIFNPTEQIPAGREIKFNMWVTRITNRAACSSRPPLRCFWHDKTMSNNSVVLVSALLLMYDSVCSQCELISLTNLASWNYSLCTGVLLILLFSALLSSRSPFFPATQCCHRHNDSKL